MNLSRRDESEMFTVTGRKPQPDWVAFLMNHEYDNIYLADNNGQYLGYVNNRSLKEYYKTGSLEIEKDICHTETEHYFDAKEWFCTHPEYCRLPILNYGKLVGEFCRLDKTGANEEKNANRNAIKKMHIFTEQIRMLCRQMGWNKISCNGTEEEYQQLCELFGPQIALSRYPVQNQADVILDLVYTKSYRKLLLKSDLKIVTLPDLMACAAVLCVKEYLEACNVNCLFLSGPEKKKLAHLYPDEAEALKHAQNIGAVLNRQEYLDQVYADDPFSKEYAGNEAAGIRNASKVISNGIHKLLLDQCNPYVNIVNGIRVTTDRPDQAENEIHVYGPCIAQGLCVTDSNTIESCLQRILNASGKSYGVTNHGVGDGGDFLNDLLYILNTKFKSGDVAVVINEFTELQKRMFEQCGLNHFESDALFEQEHYWFLNHPFHCNAKANEKIARYMAQRMEEMPSYKTAAVPCGNYWSLKNLDVHEDKDALLSHEELLQYKKWLESYRLAGTEGKQIGSVVINANPFTLGHKHLVEYAAKKVDHLYVFLVQDNPNAYNFLDRFHMVEEGCREFPNVTVLSSGKIMASVYSFPAYFQKKEADIPTVDPSMHLKIFIEVVCPILGINQRFFGEEPTDPVTNQLNIQANEILPRAGIKVTVIERKKASDQHISARAVRQLMAEERYEELLNYVPATTLKRLMELEHKKG